MQYLKLIILIVLILFLFFVLYRVVCKTICNIKYLDFKGKYKIVSWRTRAQDRNLVYKKKQLLYSDARVLNARFSKYCFFVTPDKIVALQKSNASLQTFAYGDLPQNIQKYYAMCKER